MPNTKTMITGNWQKVPTLSYCGLFTYFLQIHTVEFTIPLPPKVNKPILTNITWIPMPLMSERESN